MNSFQYIRTGVCACLDALEVDIRMSDGGLALDHGKEIRCLPEERKKDAASIDHHNENAATAATEGLQNIEFAGTDGMNGSLKLEECLGILRDTELYLNADLKEPHLEGAVLALAEEKRAYLDNLLHKISGFAFHYCGSSSI